MKPAGPFIPTTSERTRISMAGDDCSLHFDLSDLTTKQKADHYSNQVLTGMLQLALLYIAKPEDEICLYDTFTESPWVEALGLYHDMFSRLGLSPTPIENIRYHPMQGYYESVAAAPSSAEVETLYMISHSNLALHHDRDLLAMSQNLNSKVHFAEHAPAFGLPTPDTMTCKKADLRGEGVAQFMAAQTKPVMLKTLGLAGARNVTSVSNIAEAELYLDEYRDDMDVILQAKLDFDQYEEMTVDLSVSKQDIHITNVRKILFADGLWVGNLIGKGVQVSPAQEAQLLRVGEYAREHHFGVTSQSDTSDDQNLAFNLGIDYFTKLDGASAELAEIVITEINARWTGGLFPAELVRRLGIADQNVVAFIDMCPPSRFDDYVAFMQRHLYGHSSQAFAMAPMGFSPFPMEIEGTEYLFVWQIAIGDFEAFKAVKEAELGNEVLITTPNISTGL